MSSVIELLAVISAGIYGILLARKKQMDFIGVFSIALATSFGGGTLRDLFLDRHPLFWIENAHYPIIIFCLSLFACLFRKLPEKTEAILILPDALGLGLFSIAGMTAALSADCTPFIAVLMGVFTGTFGGVIGDVVCNEIPSLFRPQTKLYATCSFLGGWFFWFSGQFGVDPFWNVWSSVCVIVTLRLLAVRFDWKLPHFNG